jgi:hypothetical protein
MASDNEENSCQPSCYSQVFAEDNEDAFEYEQHTTMPVVPVVLKGRLKSHLPFWQSINANNFIIDLIRCGYRIPFISTSTREFFTNNRSALQHSQFVESAERFTSEVLSVRLQF